MSLLSIVYVGLFATNLFEDNDAEMLALGIPAFSDGSYSIKVPDGTYYPVAITTYIIGEETEDMLAGYGGGTGADPVTVSGADVSDIDMSPDDTGIDFRFGYGAGYRRQSGCRRMGPGPVLQ